MDSAASPSEAKYAVLRETFGFDSFRSGQETVIDTLLAGRNVLAVMPTGAGKSLCYQVPALVRDGLAVVVSPLVSLMRDQVSALTLAGVASRHDQLGERPGDQRRGMAARTERHAQAALFVA